MHRKLLAIGLGAAMLALAGCSAHAPAPGATQSIKPVAALTNDFSSPTSVAKSFVSDIAAKKWALLYELYNGRAPGDDAAFATAIKLYDSYGTPLKVSDWKHFTVKSDGERAYVDFDVNVDGKTRHEEFVTVAGGGADGKGWEPNPNGAFLGVWMPFASRGPAYSPNLDSVALVRDTETKTYFKAPTYSDDDGNLADSEVTDEGLDESELLPGTYTFRAYFDNKANPTDHVVSFFGSEQIGSELTSQEAMG